MVGDDRMAPAGPRHRETVPLEGKLTLGKGGLKEGSLGWTAGRASRRAGSLSSPVGRLLGLLLFLAALSSAHAACTVCSTFNTTYCAPYIASYPSGASPVYALCSDFIPRAVNNSAMQSYGFLPACFAAYNITTRSSVLPAINASYWAISNATLRAALATAVAKVAAETLSVGAASVITDALPFFAQFSPSAYGLCPTPSSPAAATTCPTGYGGPRCDYCVSDAACGSLMCYGALPYLQSSTTKRLSMASNSSLVTPASVQLLPTISAPWKLSAATPVTGGEATLSLTLAWDQSLPITCKATTCSFYAASPSFNCSTVQCYCGVQNGACMLFFCRRISWRGWAEFLWNVYSRLPSSL